MEYPITSASVFAYALALTRLGILKSAACASNASKADQRHVVNSNICLPYISIRRKLSHRPAHFIIPASKFGSIYEKKGNVPVGIRYELGIIPIRLQKIRCLSRNPRAKRHEYIPLAWNRAGANLSRKVFSRFLLWPCKL